MIGFLAVAGYPPQAEQLARTITDPHTRSVALADLAVGLNAAGHHD